MSNKIKLEYRDDKLEIEIKPFGTDMPLIMIELLRQAQDAMIVIDNKSKEPSLQEISQAYQAIAQLIIHPLIEQYPNHRIANLYDIYRNSKDKNWINELQLYMGSISNATDIVLALSSAYGDTNVDTKPARKESKPAIKKASEPDSERAIEASESESA